METNVRYAYASQLLTQLRSLCASDFLAKNEEVLNRLSGDRKPSWERVAEIETLLASGLPDSLVSQHVALYRQWLAQLGSEEIFGPFLKALDGDSKGSETPSRAKLLATLGEIQRLRTLRASFDSIRNVMTGTAVILVLGLTIWFSWLLGTWVKLTDKPVYLLLPTLFAGLLGASFSLLSRLLSIEWSPRMALTYPSLRSVATGVGLSLVISLAKGMIAALVIYAVFAGGLLQGSLFPTFVFNADEKLSFASVLHGIPVSNSDIAKLLVWCFVVGFAERLLPDFLTQLAASVRKEGASDTTRNPIDDKQRAVTG